MISKELSDVLNWKKQKLVTTFVMPITQEHEVDMHRG
jgi:hypothetical protein